MEMKPETVVAVGTRLGLEKQTLEDLADVAQQIEANADLSRLTDRLCRALREDPPNEAIALVRQAGLEDTLGVEAALTFYLGLALQQVPAAEERRAKAGIPAELTRATLTDLKVWVRHYNKQIAAQGITIEILEWAQRYLRGELVRIGALQFESGSFSGAIRVFRHRRSRTLSAVATGHGGRINLKSGELVPGRTEVHREDEWDIALEPGTRVLELHIPANSFVTFKSTAQSIRQALEFFAPRNARVKAVGAFGEGWVLDPQVRKLLPRNVGLHAVASGCCLYPSPLSEEETIRRLFGPALDREQVAKLPREGMNCLQRSVAQLLERPEASLRARGGFILRDELAALPIDG